MSYEKVKQAKKLMIGTKQASKALQKGVAKDIVIALDADQRLVTSLVELAKEKNIEIHFVDSMKKLGKASGIDVKTAAVAIIC